MEDDGPLWKRVLFNEMLIASVVIVIILVIAFYLATNKSEETDKYGDPIRHSQR